MVVVVVVVEMKSDIVELVVGFVLRLILRCSNEKRDLL